MSRSIILLDFTLKAERNTAEEAGATEEAAAGTAAEAHGGAGEAAHHGVWAAQASRYVWLAHSPQVNSETELQCCSP